MYSKRYRCHIPLPYFSYLSFSVILFPASFYSFLSLTFLLFSLSAFLTSISSDFFLFFSHSGNVYKATDPANAFVIVFLIEFDFVFFISGTVYWRVYWMQEKWNLIISLPKHRCWSVTWVCLIWLADIIIDTDAQPSLLESLQSGKVGEGWTNVIIWNPGNRRSTDWDWQTSEIRENCRQVK
jgi:hypothetical protein